jgi:glyoxylase-like metal-dependent hydrolase (beta-lactamase superfamily II)
VRAVALHPDVLLATSAIWQTNCVIVRHGEECFVIDSPILPDELDALPALIEQTGFPAPSGLLATHGDWDHLLGRLVFGGLALGCAQSTAARMSATPGEAQRELRAFDEGLLIERPRPLALGTIQELPVPGRCGIGELELELHPAEGHTADGMAIWAPWAQVLVAGDYLSAVEIPTLDGGAGSRSSAPSGAGGGSTAPSGTIDAYGATLTRLRELVRGATYVVPGHGPPRGGERAMVVLDEDLAYLHSLREHGVEAELPPRRRTRAQRAAHERNCAQLTPASS